MISGMFKDFIKHLLGIVFPPLCLSCKRRLNREEAGAAICGDCFGQIEISSGFYCPKCKRRLPEAKKSCHPETKFILAACANYENNAVRELIHVLKYNRVKNALCPISKILEMYLGRVFRNLDLDIRNFVIIPIPLHFKKEHERGFNQAALIASAVAESINKITGALCYSRAPQSAVKIEIGNLVRIKNTESQTKIASYKVREVNVANCFKVQKPERIAAKNILLIDDVFTSGATMREAVRTLKQAGAGKIIGFVIAKA